jgi:cytochrome c
MEVPGRPADRHQVFTFGPERKDRGVRHSVRRRGLGLLAGCVGLAAGLLVAALDAGAAPLRNLADEQVVARIRYCRGARQRFPELNLRFKTDGSRDGPEPGKPALLPAGMRGDRAQVIFSGLEDLKRFLVEGCEGAAP